MRKRRKRDEASSLKSEELLCDVLTSDVGVLTRKDFDDLFPRHHVDGVVVRRAAEFALLRGGRVPERHAQAAADAEIRANGADHPAVAIRFLDDAAGHRAGRLT